MTSSWPSNLESDDSSSEFKHAKGLFSMLQGVVLGCLAIMYDQQRRRECKRNSIRLLLNSVPCIPCDPLSADDEGGLHITLVPPKYICTDLDADLGRQARAVPSMIRGKSNRVFQYGSSCVSQFSDHLRFFYITCFKLTSLGF